MNEQTTPTSNLPTWTKFFPPANPCPQCRELHARGAIYTTTTKKLNGNSTKCSLELDIRLLRMCPLLASNWVFFQRFLGTLNFWKTESSRHEMGKERINCQFLWYLNELIQFEFEFEWDSLWASVLENWIRFGAGGCVRPLEYIFYDVEQVLFVLLVQLNDKDEWVGGDTQSTLLAPDYVLPLYGVAWYGMGLRRHCCATDCQLLKFSNVSRQFTPSIRDFIVLLSKSAAHTPRERERD